MSRSKFKEEFIYFSKNIRKNLLTKPFQSIERPKTSIRSRLFSSSHYRPTNQPPVQQSQKLNTIELGNNFYIKFSKSTHRRNGKSFFEQCVHQNEKQSAIKRIIVQNKLNPHTGNLQLQQFVESLRKNIKFFCKLQPTMVESLSIMGIVKNYPKITKINYNNSSVGFILYGKVKLLSEDFSVIVKRGDTIGQNIFHGLQINLRMKMLEQSGILWISGGNFQILKEQSAKQGFRHDFNQLEAQLRMEFIKKNFKKKII